MITAAALLAGLAAALCVLGLGAGRMAAQTMPTRRLAMHSLSAGRTALPMLGALPATALGLALGVPPVWLGVLAMLGGALAIALHTRLGEQARRAMAQDMPGRLELAALALSAGLALEPALRAAARPAGAAGPAMARFAALLTLMPDRAAAFTTIAAQAGAPNAPAQWPVALHEAERGGAPLAAVLANAAERARAEALHAAELAAASLPARLTLPIVMFFLPALLALVVGPAVLAWRTLPH